MKDINLQYELKCISIENTEEVIAIEKVCFPPNEACSAKSMTERIAVAPECFLIAVDRKNNKIAGFLNGIATGETIFRDEFFTDASLHEPEGQTLMLLGLDVLPEYRKQGLATSIMKEYMCKARENRKKLLILTCLEDKVEMYKKMGYEDLGVSNSTWGGEQWHEMKIEL